uniref:Uncharacterized protein n=1 Tax=Arundo donax TaxID=35708 RepID=A0A0A8YI49_ARUDO
MGESGQGKGVSINGMRMCGRSRRCRLITLRSERTSLGLGVSFSVGLEIVHWGSFVASLFGFGFQYLNSELFLRK